MEELTLKTIACISGWLREQNQPVLMSEQVDLSMASNIPPFHDRADKLMLAIEDET